MLTNDEKPRSERRMDGPNNEEYVGPPFVEYATMFKVESEPSFPRHLECISCGKFLSWTTYYSNPHNFDRKCQACSVRARDFYKTRPHRELNDAQERNNRGTPEADLPGSG